MIVFRSILLSSNLFIVGLTLLAYLSPMVKPQNFWVLQFVGMSYPFLLLFNVFFVVGWLLFRKRYFLISLSTILIGWSHFNNFIGFSFPEKSRSSKSLKVLTYNIDNFTHFQKGTEQTKRIAAFEKFIRSEDPDIICFQESFITTAEYSSRIKKFPVLAEYRYIFHPVEKGMVIFSKFPATKTAKINMKEDRVETANGANYADVQIHGEIFRLLITHLQSNSVRERTADVIEDHFRSEETRQTALAVIKKIRDMSYFRAAQSEAIHAFIKQSPYPVIVAGDFNDTPQSYTYSQISNGLQDAFARKGSGLGITYGGIIPGLRIDYILVDPKFKIISYKIPKVSFSDHYPVLAEIDLSAIHK
ncbi:MAG: endonuclease/exonuclease/phosphatase family protein [Saprospiraceae bacterium]